MRKEESSSEKYLEKKDYRKASSKYKKNRYKSSVKGKPSYRASTEVPDVDQTHTNDISWWNKAAPLFADATRVPFNRILGDPLVTSGPAVAGVTLPTRFYAMPGIMRFDYVPSIGYANSSNDPVNRSFTSIYGDIYSRTTGAMQFTQSDLALFVLGVSSIIQMIGVMKRALGVCQLYASKNYYYPLQLLAACGFNAADIISNQDDYRRRLNQAIQSVNAMRVPNFIDLFKRHYTLASNVWLDEDSPEAQMFVFTPQYYYVYNDAASKLGATATQLTVAAGSAFLTKIENALAAWRNSSDLGLISGSIQRAYKDSSLLTLDMVALDSVVLPTFDKTMLKQINNAIILNSAAVNVASLDITQNVVTNVTTFSPKMTGTINGAVLNAAYCRNEVVLNAADGDVSPDAVMEMTRLVTFGYWNGADVLLVYCGTEIITDASIYQMYKDTASGVPTIDVIPVSGSYQTALGTDPAKLADFIEEANVLSRFRNAPRIECGLHTGTGPYTVSQRYQLGDVYTYTLLDRAAYEGLQSAALQSIYVVNELTKPNNIQK